MNKINDQEFKVGDRVIIKATVWFLSYCKNPPKDGMITAKITEFIPGDVSFCFLVDKKYESWLIHAYHLKKDIIGLENKYKVNLL